MARSQRAPGQALSATRLTRAVRLAVLVAVGNLLLLSACGGSEVTLPNELPSDEAVLGEAADDEAVLGEAADEVELSAEEIFLGEESAMLKIERDWDFGALGFFEMGADFTIRTTHGLLDEPRKTNKVFGSTESEFILEMGRTGTTGGIATTTATGPVSYEVEGFFYPASEGCEFHFVVTETLRLSQVTSMTDTQMGVIPVPGLGADVVTAFEVDFDPESLDFFLIAGSSANSSFTLYDIVLPDGTDCIFTG